MATGEIFYDKVGSLTPHNPLQEALKGQILATTTDIAQTRSGLAAQKDSSIPLPFLVVLVFWLIVLFAGYGLMAATPPLSRC